MKRNLAIVVPTDFSPGSMRALRFALLLAAPGGKVMAVHAVDPLEYKFGPGEVRRSRREKAWTSAQQSMARWLRDGDLRTVDAIVIEGEAAPAIAEFAVSRHADLVVLSTSARRSAKRILLGSVAEELFRELPCPVAVLGPRVRLWKKRKLRRLVFATDLEPLSLAALPQLSRLASRYFSNVTIIRAFPSDRNRPATRARLRRETRERFETAADSPLRARTRKIEVIFAPPAKAITSMANRVHADAITMAVRSGGQLTRAATHIPWTVAHRVIAEATRPVITFRVGP